MGSCTFDTYSVGKSPDDAFENAQRHAEEYYGHQEGYSGQINSKTGFVEVPYHMYKGKKNHEKVAWELVDDDWAGTDSKWGPAGCMEIKGQKANRIKKAKGVSGKKGYKAYYFFGWAPC